MNKPISSRIESIFAHAVAMDQSGKLRNTIFAFEDRIYIFNSDATVLLRFSLRKNENPFQNPIAFCANDYDSKEFREENGMIVFVTQEGDYTREKKCKTPDMAFEDVEQLFEKYSDNDMPLNETTLNRGILSLLNTNLSHIEFSADDQQLMVVQRDIYSGTRIEIKRSIQKRGLGLTSDLDMNDDFDPIGIRTNDFTALFSFQENIAIGFPGPDQNCDFITVKSTDSKMDMTGIIACCLFDGLGTVEEAQSITKKRRRK